ncbi:PTH2-domain-containing protein [Mycena metata]|uniref:peptidyl-tRNA hydrolase n=1 Tax=Mycena metata TaxID=1033252 RepID=A0AAD7P310_9AGAR|nr:PTH2-domain-containing protein [Mycena metata]
MDLAATYLAAATVFTSLGYHAGRLAKPLQVQTAPPHQRQPKTTSRDDSDSESEDGNVSALTTSDECKLVLAVRTDLGMTPGKIAAQHATLACYKTLASKNPDLLRRWAHGGYLKSVVRCSDEDELLLLQAQAQSLNLCARSIQDAGRTQIAAGSTTVLGIVGPSMLVEQVTEQLAAF